MLPVLEVVKQTDDVTTVVRVLQIEISYWHFIITLLFSKLIISLSFSPDRKKMSFARRIFIATFCWVSRSIARITDENTPFLFASLWFTW